MPDPTPPTPASDRLSDGAFGDEVTMRVIACMAGELHGRLIQGGHSLPTSDSNVAAFKQIWAAWTPLIVDAAYTVARGAVSARPRRYDPPAS